MRWRLSWNVRLNGLGCACARACVRAFVCVCACASVYGRMHMAAVLACLLTTLAGFEPLGIVIDEMFSGSDMITHITYPLHF